MGSHQLERIGAEGWRCTNCTWPWTRPPVNVCPGAPRYSWWPAVPEHLKTQRKQAGLKLNSTVKTCVAGRHEWY
jgi:hypothetical protein